MPPIGRPAPPLSRRRALAGLAAAGAAFPLGAALLPDAPAADPAEPMPIDAALAALFEFPLVDTPRVAAALAAHPDRDIAPALILALRYSAFPTRAILDALIRLTGERDRVRWFDWMLWQEAHPEITPRPSFTALKRMVYLRIDPNFEVFLRDPYLDRGQARIRFEEVAWGGVLKDEIPSLDRPPMIAAGAADYLLEDDLVFGVAIEGDVRAYPLRIMGWHEMFNDVVGGVPVALAYCTLCGAGILFETAVAGRAAPFVFGSSGFLYRSNKLMFDRETHTLWNQFTGEPVIGPLAARGLALAQRPLVVTRWDRWRAEHPSTTVLSLETGHIRDYDSGVAYSAYFASPELMFPTAPGDGRLAAKDLVFGVRGVGAAKAWPLDAFAGGRVLNDRVGALDLVLIGDRDAREVRAYASGGRRFRAAGGAGRLAETEGGAVWTVGEAALSGPDGARAPRVAGHVAYWFAWDGYMGVASDLFAE